MMQRDLVIVGAGPAGMAAAVAGTRAGLDVTLIDENHSTGGQIYRQAPATLSALPVPADSSSVDGKHMIGEVESLKNQIEWLPETSVWGLLSRKKTCRAFATRMADYSGQGSDLRDRRL